MEPDWAENIQKQCLKSNVLFFFKQWGSWESDGVFRNKKANGRLLQGRKWDEMPIADELHVNYLYKNRGTINPGTNQKVYAVSDNHNEQRYSVVS